MRNPLVSSLPFRSSYWLAVIILLFCSGCGDSSKIKIPVKTVAAAQVPVAVPEASQADAATILSRTEVPVLCYHQIRDFLPSDSRTARDYIVPIKRFQEQMQLLADSGYQTILPAQLNDYLQYGKPLPPKPVMITFDDTRVDQYTVGLPALNQHRFKGAFFIMTVSIGRPGYMTKEQVKQLAIEGHSIGSHTWNHNNVKKYAGEDWVTQIEKPSKQLAAITGQPIEYFAYPFGLWNKEAIPELKRRGFKSAFQLSAKMDDADPLFSIRRIIVPGEWTAATLLKVMKKTFPAKI